MFKGRKRDMVILRKLILALSIVGMAVGSGYSLPIEPDETNKVVLNIDGFKSSKGQAIISVHDNEETFLDIATALKSWTQPIKDTKMRVVIDSLLPGEYAISVIHDEDKDGKLKQWFFVGPPKEGVGISQNQPGIPKFDKSKFVLTDEDLEFDIKIKYIGKKGK
ncbi:MAG: DUF2141 domain-containing protein [Candidatus Cloacimonetes bacterium]|nr:DUF2141 domain-containing protein [Candidatus Cloacimonadota bacterium]